MEDISHHVLNYKSIFKIYKSKNKSFLYSILAALYSSKIDRRSFHHPHPNEQYKKDEHYEYFIANEEQKIIIHFLQDNPKLNISIRLFDSIMTSQNDMKIYEHRIIGTGTRVINI